MYVLCNCVITLYQKYIGIFQNFISSKEFLFSKLNYFITIIYNDKKKCWVHSQTDRF